MIFMTCLESLPHNLIKVALYVINRAAEATGEDPRPAYTWARESPKVRSITSHRSAKLKLALPSHLIHKQTRKRRAGHAGLLLQLEITGQLSTKWKFSSLKSLLLSEYVQRGESESFCGALPSKNGQIDSTKRLIIEDLYSWETRRPDAASAIGRFAEG
jgi:hypothetical protein